MYSYIIFKFVFYLTDVNNNVAPSKNIKNKKNYNQHKIILNRIILFHLLNPNLFLYLLFLKYLIY